MCLFVSKPRNNKRKFVYKRFYKRENGELISPYKRTVYKQGKEKKAKGILKRTKYELDSAIQAGIHCYSSLKTAKDNLFWGQVVVKCSVKPEDWLADGDCGECLYRKITPIKIVYKL